MSVATKYERLSESIGVRVDFDLSKEFNETQIEMLRGLLDQHHLLLFRGKEISREEQVRLTAAFGDITQTDGYVSNVLPGKASGGELIWHSDYFYAPGHPIRGIALYAEELSPGVPSTRFANALRAFELLPDDLRTLLEGCSALHITEPRSGDRHLREEDATEAGRKGIHPAIVQHPRNNRPLIGINALHTARLRELDPEASEKALHALYAYLYEPANIYEHQWELHDLVMWDNIALQHARSYVEKDGAPRTLRRTSFGDASNMEPDLLAFYKSRD